MLTNFFFALLTFCEVSKYSGMFAAITSRVSSKPIYSFNEGYFAESMPSNRSGADGEYDWSRCVWLFNNVSW